MSTHTLRTMAVALLAMTLAACAAPATQSRASTDNAATPTDASAAQPKPAAVAAPSAAPAKPTAAAPAAVATDRSCRTNADCAIKDVGSCCGSMPACVNKNSRPDPAAVKAQCEQRGMASVCGFEEIKGCGCNNGQCVADQAPVGGWIENEAPPPAPVR